MIYKIVGIIVATSAYYLVVIPKLFNFFNAWIAFAAAIGGLLLLYKILNSKYFKTKTQIND